jgi:hypothetical protein
MKRLLIISLFSAIFLASIFMIVESGEYYSTFYKNNYQGYWAAFLVEVFLAISAMLSFNKRPGLNIVIKTVMIPLFLVVVAGASLKVVSPMLDKLAKTENQDKLVNFLMQENKQSKENLDFLKGQRINTAIELKHRREMTLKLRSELESQTSYTWMIWVTICFSTFLRFSVQLANLVFAHCLGIVLRGEKKKITARKTPVRRKRRKRKILVKEDNVGVLEKELKVV